jgi:hypothetical protein
MLRLLTAGSGSTKQRYRVVCYSSAFGGKADIYARMIDAAGADRSGAKLPSALRDQNIDLRQLRYDLFRIVPLQSSLMSKTWGDLFEEGE